MHVSVLGIINYIRYRTIYRYRLNFKKTDMLFSYNYNATTKSTELVSDFPLCVLCALCGLLLITCWKIPAMGKIAQLYFS